MIRFRRTALLLALALTPVRAEAYHPQWSEALMQRMSGTRLFHHADFNSDGRPDFLTHSTGLLNLATLNANGTFNPYTTIYTGSYVSDTTTAEVTSDGKVDLIVADTATNTITVVPSNGDGTFGTPIINNLTIAPSQLARGDYNGDGKLDLAVRSYSAALLAVYAGDGAGHFSELSRTPTATSIYRITAGDVDGDGKMDAVLSNNVDWRHELYFGRGDGTFDAPIYVTAPAVLPPDVQVADLDNDGDQEIVSCEFATNTLTVFRNNGSRSFAAFDSYTLVPDTIGNPSSLAIGDFTGDENVDVAVSLINASGIATLQGNGNGTFAAPFFARIPQRDTQRFRIHGLAAVEATGDDRIDLLMSGDRYVGVFANTSGDVRLTLAQTYPVVSTGDKAQFTAWFYPPEKILAWYDQPYGPAPTGLVTFRNGDTVLGSVTPTRNGQSTASATFEITLPAGTHSITAEYAGDDSYRAATTINAVTQRVIPEKTTTSVTEISTGGISVPWGESWFMSAAVTSELPGTPSRIISLVVNGQLMYEPRMPAPSGTTTVWLEPGTYDIHAEYGGDETHPPSRSAPFRQVVTKALTETNFTHNGEYLAGAGQTPQLQIHVSGFGGATGTVHIYNGATRLTTFDATGYETFTMPALPVGVHYLRAEYEGGTKWLPSESRILRYHVVPQGFVVVATAAADASSISVNARYSAEPAPSLYRIYERVGTSAWTHVLSSPSASYLRSGPGRGKVYSYRMEALNASGALLGTSNTDVTVVATFTDDALRAGTPIKAVHVQEVVSAANLLRVQGGLAAITLADAAPGKPIRKSHLDFLSNAIAEGRAAAGASAPPALAIAPASLVRGAHILQLREALK